MPSDLYHLYLMSRQIDIQSITLFLANAHIYETNLEAAKQLLEGNEEAKFVLNV